MGTTAGTDSWWCPPPRSPPPRRRRRGGWQKCLGSLTCGHFACWLYVRVTSHPGSRTPRHPSALGKGDGWSYYSTTPELRQGPVVDLAPPECCVTWDQLHPFICFHLWGVNKDLELASKTDSNRERVLRDPTPKASTDRMENQGQRSGWTKPCCLSPAVWELHCVGPLDSLFCALSITSRCFPAALGTYGLLSARALARDSQHH